jgi:predicted Fe-S protein YdhL (DUF1289 family)
MISPPKPVASPCIKVCIVDGESGLCLGCLRTLDEIAAWGGLPEPERAAITADLPGRRGRVDPRKLGLG